MFSELTLVFTSFSVDQSSEQLREDPGFTLLYVCAAILSGVNPFHLFEFSNDSVTQFLNLCVFVSRMITLKVLNSIVLLGTSCKFVKEANMEEKLFEPPPSAVSSRVNSRANRTKVIHTPQKGRGGQANRSTDNYT